MAASTKRRRNRANSSRANSGGYNGRGWVRRTVVAGSLSVLAGLGVLSSLSNVIAKSAPEAAYALSLGNGRIASVYAEDEFALRPDSVETSPGAKLARNALLADPTAVEALSVLGFQAQLRGDNARADRIFAHSARLSRRELRPRIWAIENAVTRGDVDEALRNYDVALRTSYEAQGVLFPTLASALPEPRIRARLLEILSTKPEWAAKFVNHVGTNAAEPEAAIRFFNEGQRIGLPVENADRARIVNALINRGKPEAAWEYYQSFRAGAERDGTRDPQFELMDEVRAMFDWQIGRDRNLSAAILRDGDKGLMDFSAPPGASGILLQQTQLLLPGTYRLQGRSAGIDQPDRTLPYWSLTCQDGRELGRVTVPRTGSGNGAFAGEFTVPAGCVQQELTLTARASDKISGVSGQILEARLSRSGN